MAQETRLKANRAKVADLLTEAAAGLKEAEKSLKRVSDLLVALEQAQKTVGKAQALAEAKPEGYRPLPAPIRAKVRTLANRIDRTAREIRVTPVTPAERLLSKRAKVPA